MREDKFKVKGIVTEALPDANFRIELENGKKILAYLSGKMRINRIRVVPGDKVLVEMTGYDDQRGRIVFRGDKIFNKENES